MIIMLEESSNEENKKNQNCILNNALQILEELDKEMKMLCDEKTYLLDIEDKLILKINEEIETKRQKREQLKTEIGELKRRCEELTNFINTNLYE
jgi:hypothetical protein